MSLRKRALSSGETRLSARPSPYHSAVTLVEAAIVAESSSSSVRRSKRVKVESTSAAVDVHEDATYVQEEITEKTSKARPKSPRKPRKIPDSLDNPHPAPVNWRETYDTIKEMRSRIKAPVDTMGCDQAQLKEQEPKNQRFATLVSLMLSSQTKDEVTDAAVARLREAVGGTLSVDAVLQADDSVISEAICKVGFWRRKTGYIKKAAERLRDDFDSDVPKTVDELCSLPGVGPKMAFLALQVAWNLNHGIGVDVHVHRITNRLGWHRPPTKTPEQTRLNLQSWLPKELHGEINHLLVGFGQTVCLPVNPLCDLCELPSKMLCPSARKVVKSKTKKAVLVQAESGPKVEIGIEEENTILEQRDDSSELSSS